MNNSFGLVVIGSDGTVINKILSPNLPLSVVEEAVALGRDIYRLLQAIAEEFNYKLPKTINIVLDSYEVAIMRRKDRIIIAVYMNALPEKKRVEATVEA